MEMKRIITLTVAALLLAAPATVQAAREPSVTVGTPKARPVTTTWSVNMHCHKCVEKLTENLSFLKGVKNVDISLEKKTVAITYDPSKTSDEALEKVIAKLGYKAVKQ